MYNNELEISRINNAIEEDLDEITLENRGKIARRILKSTRDLNDNVAYKIYKKFYPNEGVSLKNVAKKFVNIKGYKFIYNFDHYLQKVVSHFTPSDDGAERLLIKYYEYLLKLKSAMKKLFDVDILNNIDKFILDLDEETNEFYKRVAERIEEYSGKIASNDFDIYYIYKKRPFVNNGKIYYEFSFESANNMQNKFNRITAFTDMDINTTYAVALSFYKVTINIIGENIPVLIVNNWNISIRPCELQNFAKILNINLKIDRSYKEYSEVMNLLKENEINLLDIVKSSNKIYKEYKNKVIDVTKTGYSGIFNVLDVCRKYVESNLVGSKSIIYLLYKMNNKIIKSFYPENNSLSNLYLHTKCYPFELKPFSFYPANHTTNLYDLLNCFEVKGHEYELLARKIRMNTEQEGILYNNFESLSEYGTKEEIVKMINIYNSNLYSGHRPKSELGIYKDYVYQKGYELDIKYIVDKLKLMSNENNKNINLFENECIDSLKLLEKDKLDSEDKEKILLKMKVNSRIHAIYGPAGTGKTTITNLISNLFDGKLRLYLAKTNAAVSNLKSRINNKDEKCCFMTIDSFLSDTNYFKFIDFDLIIIDECSTIKNSEILSILNYIHNGMVILTGDIYQIESIGYGSWFKIIKNILPDHCIHELTIPHRTAREALNVLWNEIRNMGEDNEALENIVRSDFSAKLNKNIFEDKCEDEIILCLNYNGLYGLNNINRFMQINNKNNEVEIGVLQYKEGDKILFNDSKRFEILRNNLKGKILKIVEKTYEVDFYIAVYEVFTQQEIDKCEGLEYIFADDKNTIIKFTVKKNPPYYHDQDHDELDHVIPFQVAYAVSIHKSQGLEYDSVKIVITDESEEQITHDIFYTAITRARKELTIYWSPEVCNRVLKRIRPNKNIKDFQILKKKYNL